MWHLRKFRLLFGFSLACAGAISCKAQSFYSDTTTSFRSRFELGKASNQGTFLITPYKPVFVLPGVFSRNPNLAPQSENHDYSWTSDDLPLNAVEAKFQLSFKTKVLQGIFAGHGDLWMAYTQSSR